MNKQYLFSSESVSDGHPDKLADTISDSILDYVLSKEPYARVACETFITNQRVIIAGEIGVENESFLVKIGQKVPQLVRDTLRNIGYSGDFSGINPESCNIQVHFNQQSVDIHQGVARNDGAIGAGDQGMMFGYATDESTDYLPLPLSLGHQLMRKHQALRAKDAFQWLRPDAKAQVTMLYENNVPVAVQTVVLSTQHSPEVSDADLRKAVLEKLIQQVIPERLRAPDIQYLINPTGRFEIGGPAADTGLTGRKIIVDTYGGACPHGGGAFSGKDPTKVDRSGAYMARYIALNIVAAGLAHKCTIQISYAIGIPEPVSLYVDTHGTGKISEKALEAAVNPVFDLTPHGIIKTLDLRRAIYRPTATFGHFGRNLPEFSWEKPDRIDELKAELHKYIAE